MNRTQWGALIKQVENENWRPAQAKIDAAKALLAASDPEGQAPRDLLDYLDELEPKARQDGLSPDVAVALITKLRAAIELENEMFGAWVGEFDGIEPTSSRIHAEHDALPKIDIP